MTRLDARSGRDPQKGAALALTLIAITALLGLGALTVLSVRTELVSAGQSRFSQAALYAAESGANAGMEYLRTACTASALFSEIVNPNNVDALKPEEIIGNGKRPGETGNAFDPDNSTWYDVTVLNNLNDPSLAAGDDSDGDVVLRVTGYGPDQTVAVIEVEVKNQECIQAFCAASYAQRGLSATNEANAACSATVDISNLRTVAP